MQSKIIEDDQSAEQCSTSKRTRSSSTAVAGDRRGLFSLALVLLATKRGDIGMPFHSSGLYKNLLPCKHNNIFQTVEAISKLTVIRQLRPKH